MRKIGNFTHKIEPLHFMIAITRQTGTFAALLLFITVLVTILRLYLNPFEIELAECSFLPQWWQALISSMLLFLTATMVNRTAVKIGIFSGFGTLPMTLYGFIACGVLMTPNLLTASVAALFVALGMMFMLRATAVFGDKESVFTGALFLGTAAVVYPPCMVIAVVMMLAVLIIPLNIRQMIIAFVGLVLPIAAVSYANWYMGGELLSVPIAMWESLFASNNLSLLEPLAVVTVLIALVVVVLLLWGISVGLYYRYSLLVPVRKSMVLEIVLLVATIGMLFLPGCGITMLPIIAVPAAVVAAFAIDRMSQKMANIFYGALVLLVLLHLLVY